VPVIVSVPATVISVVVPEFWTWLNLAASLATVPAPKLVILKPPSGMLAVTVVWPSLHMAVDRPVARSEFRELAAVLLMTVPLTYGVPAELMTNVPEPLYDIILFLFYAFYGSFNSFP
jgi:hypothetical protein